MEFDALIERWEAPLTRHLEGLVRSPELAEDLRQELFLRAWRDAPRDGGDDRVGAWLYRVASNLAVDALRRQRVRRWEELPEGIAAPRLDGDERLDIDAALAELRPHDRLLVTLHLAGFQAAEVGALLDIEADAARKRLARARERFARAYRDTRPARAPVVLLSVTEEDPAPYRTWLAAGGAEVRVLRDGEPVSVLAAADAVVITGSVADIHPAAYGERARGKVVRPDLRRDRRELGLVRQALARDIPLLGICRGHQLLNIANGGTLYQDVSEQAADASHVSTRHDIATTGGTDARRLLGRRTPVRSRHHQTLRRVGRGLTVSSTSDDGVVEMIEDRRRTFAVGVQWHPEDGPGDEASVRVRDGLIDAIERRAA